MNKLIVCSLLLLLKVNFICAQSEMRLCKAIEKGKFGKVERIVKRQIKSLPEFKESDASGKINLSMEENVENLTLWFKNMNCVEDAFEDKCQNKIAIYPGWSIIGVKFKTSSGIEEKCFSIQKGTTGTINIFGWHPKVSRMKNKLVYKKMYNCPGFVEEQKRNCVQLK